MNRQAAHEAPSPDAVRAALAIWTRPQRLAGSLLAGAVPQLMTGAVALAGAICVALVHALLGADATLNLSGTYNADSFFQAVLVTVGGGFGLLVLAHTGTAVLAIAAHAKGATVGGAWRDALRRYPAGLALMLMTTVAAGPLALLARETMAAARRPGGPVVVLGAGTLLVGLGSVWLLLRLPMLAFALLDQPCSGWPRRVVPALGSVRTRHLWRTGLWLLLPMAPVLALPLVPETGWRMALAVFAWLLLPSAVAAFAAEYRRVGAGMAGRVQLGRPVLTDEPPDTALPEQPAPDPVARPVWRSLAMWLGAPLVAAGAAGVMIWWLYLQPASIDHEAWAAILDRHHDRIAFRPEDETRPGRNGWHDYRAWAHRIDREFNSDEIGPAGTRLDRRYTPDAGHVRANPALMADARALLAAHPWLADMPDAAAARPVAWPPMRQSRFSWRPWGHLWPNTWKLALAARGTAVLDSPAGFRQFAQSVRAMIRCLGRGSVSAWRDARTALKIGTQLTRLHLAEAGDALTVDDLRELDRILRECMRALPPPQVPQVLETAAIVTQLDTWRFDNARLARPLWPLPIDTAGVDPSRYFALLLDSTERAGCDPTDPASWRPVSSFDPASPLRAIRERRARGMLQPGEHHHQWRGLRTATGLLRLAIRHLAVFRHADYVPGTAARAVRVTGELGWPAVTVPHGLKRRVDPPDFRARPDAGHALGLLAPQLSHLPAGPGDVVLVLADGTERVRVVIETMSSGLDGATD